MSFANLFQRLNVLLKRSFIIDICFLPAFLFSQETSTLVKLEQDLRRLVENVKPSVVTVSAKMEFAYYSNRSSSFFGFGSEKKEVMPIEMTNIGSGIVFDSTHIITNASIVSSGKSITVGFCNGDELEGTLIGTDHDIGVAVIKINKLNLKPVAFQTSEQLSAGSCVAIVGNSLGVTPAVSLGIVNAIRTDGIIQLSANIPAGIAGGPVFDAHGRLAGLLAGQISPIGDEIFIHSNIWETNAALAYPSHAILQAAMTIINRKSTPEGWIGVEADDWPGGKGWVHIIDVKLGSPAHEAGIRMGDIVFSMNNLQINGSRNLAKDIKSSRPAAEVYFGILRSDSTHIIKVRIGNADENPEMQQRRDKNKPMFSLTPSPFGAVKLEMDDQSRRMRNLNQEFLLMRVNQLEEELSILRSLLKQK